MKGLKYTMALAALCSGSMLFGQGVVEALRYSQQDIRGTARYMGMAGAFGALGGDITTLSHNPAGIGVYRNSDVAATLDLSNQVSNTSVGSNRPVKDSKFSVACNNFGFVWSLRFNQKALKNLNFGFAYNKQASFNRSYKAHYPIVANGSSLTNYIAKLSNGFSKNDLAPTDYDAYSDMPWLNVLGATSMLINPVSTDNGQESREWKGVVSSDAVATGELYVDEKGSIDEFNFNFGGNLYNVLYWGVGITVTDFSYDMQSRYGEKFENGLNVSTNELISGKYTLHNKLRTTGSGVKANMGVIVRIENNLRLGLAVHTPNYYKMTDTYVAKVENNFAKNTTTETPAGTSYYEFTSPWRLEASAAYVFGRKGILSFDYEYTAGNKMMFEDPYTIDQFYDTNQDIADKIAPMHTFKVGGELMVTKQLSARLGYAHQTSPVRSTYRSGIDMPTVGTTTIFTLDRGTNYFTAGIGYKFSNMYVDAAYVHRYRKSDIFPFSPLTESMDNTSLSVSPEVATLNDHNNSFALTIGVKF